MTPRRIFFFGAGIIILIFAISLVFPPNGFRSGSLVFHFPDYRMWFRKDTSAFKDISSIIAINDSIDHNLDHDIKDTLQFTDSISSGQNGYQIKDITHVDSVSYLYAFEFPESDDTLLYPLFRKLDIQKNRNRPVRIMHYGDSQIEADHITSGIRNFMQKQFGGSGIGLIPVVPATDASLTFQQELSSHWKRFSVLDKKNDLPEHNLSFGVMGSISRYIAGNDRDTTAHIGLRPFYYGYRNVRSFTHARLYYGKSITPATLIVNDTDTLKFKTGENISELLYESDRKRSTLNLRLTGYPLPDIFGITLDGKNGVAVDNISLRGSSGLDFSRLDTSLLRKSFLLMEVEMLILQFGANIVPVIRNNYDFYRESFSRQLQILKKIKPGLTILVIGVNDVSQNSPSGYQTYPNLVKIRDAQKKAAFENNCLFWDLYEAMGGENSMPSWVTADPPLARKDYVHFTYQGAKIVSELFCRAWSQEYINFIKNNTRRP